MIEFYHIKEIFCVLERNQIINEKIKYQESDKYYPNISKYLNQNQISYITDMKQFETGGFMDLKKIDTNFINKSVNNKYYIDDFELIDGKFFSFLYHKIFNTRLQFFRAFYLTIENKIFLDIIIGQSRIYEIVSLNPNGGDIIVEYLIEFVPNNLNFGDKTLIPSIVQICANKNYQNDILLRNPILIGNNIHLIFHKIYYTNNQINPPNPETLNRQIIPQQINNRTKVLSQSSNPRLSNIGSQGFKQGNLDLIKSLNKDNIIKKSNTEFSIVNYSKYIKNKKLFNSK